MLEADPDLARGLDAEALAEASRRAIAMLGVIPAGPWSPNVRGDTAGMIGLLVLDGLVARTVHVGSERSTELVGPGDLLRPWQDDGGNGLVESSSEWHALKPTQVAILDRAFALAIAPWPELSAELYGRALRRSRWESVAAAICHIRRVDERLLAFLWHLADRWGRVTPDGIEVPVALTHAELAGLVGAQRPSVTTALAALRARGFVERRGDRSWIVTRAARDELEATAPAASLAVA